MTRRAFLCVLFAAAFSVLGAGCGDDDGGEGGLVTLSAVTPDPVPLTLGLATGTMVFDFSADPLDMAHANSMQAVLYTGGINVTVTSTDSGVSCVLTDGIGVMDAPNAPGEYTVAAAEDGTSVTVTFYNSFDGLMLTTDNTYTATVDVIENDFFTVESFARGVSLL